MRKIITGIDIGTGTTRVIVAELQKGETVPSILGVGEVKNTGMRHGSVTSTVEVSESIKKALAIAEESAKLKIKRAYVAVGGASLKGEVATGSAIVSKADNEVTELDINKALEEAEEGLNLNNKKIIQVFPITYKLDGKEVTGRVLGMHGTKLEVKALFATASKAHLEDLLEALGEAGVTPIDIIASPVAGAEIVLSRKHKMVGVLVVDMGAETTSIAVYENEVPVYLHTFSLGGEDVTNDIALGLKTTLEEAEGLKLGSVVGNFPKKKLDEIIEARFSDIFELIDNHLKKIKRSELLPAGVIWIGGAANTQNLIEMSKHALKLPSKIGTIEMFGNAKTKLRDPAWATALGLIISTKHIESYTEGTLPNFWKDLKGALKAGLKQLMP